MSPGFCAPLERLETRTLLSSTGTSPTLGADPGQPDRAIIRPSIGQTYYMFATINSSTIPSTIVAGVGATGRIKFSVTGLDITNSRRPLSISVVLVDGPVPYDTTVPLPVGRNIRSGVLQVGPNQGVYSGSVAVRIPSRLMAAGTYSLSIAASMPDDGNGDTFGTYGYAQNSQELIVVPPQIGLTASVARSTFAASVIAGSRKSESATLALTNIGNATTPGKTTVLLYEAAGGIVDANATLLASVSRPLRIKVGKSFRLTLPVKRIPAIQPGDYKIVAQVTDPVGKMTPSMVASQTITS